MIIELPIGRSRYKVECSEDEEEKFLRLAEILNKRVNSTSISTRITDEKTLLVIAALAAEEELDAIDRPEVNNQDLYDAVSENMENIAEYLENLIGKIQNY
jgi:cell division protein ZapA (FtsZ GTPase activity inhibitor)